LNKEETYRLLERKGIQFETFEHGAVYTIEEMDALDLPGKERIAKNLFLRDAQKQNYYLVAVPGHKRVDLKALGKTTAGKSLKFASEEDLRGLLLLEKGSVTPLGALNSRKQGEGKNLTVVLDRELEGRTIGVHPMENTATVFLAFEDLVGLLEGWGCHVEICRIPAREE